MAETIIAVAVKIGTEVAFAVSASLPFTGPAATAIAAAAGFTVIGAVVVGTTLAINAALAPNIPSPEGGKQSFRQTIPYHIRGVGKCRRSGPTMLFEARDNTFYQVIALNAGLVAGFGAAWLHDGKVDYVGDLLSLSADMPAAVQQTADGSYETGRIRLQARRGHATEAPYLKPATDLPAAWSASHRGDGVASLCMVASHGKLEDYTKQYPNGRPEPSLETFHIAYDWRDPAQDRFDEETWQYTENPIVNMIHDLWFVRGYDWDRRIAPSLAQLTFDADHCDVAVTTKSGGTVARYAMGGFYTLDAPETDVHAKMLECFDGFWTWKGDGSIVLMAGRYYEPTVVIDDDDMTSLAVQRWVEREQVVNELVLSFTSPELDYTQVDTDSWTDEAAILALGETKSTPMALTWVHYNNQGRRLAKRKMARHGAQLRGTSTCRLSGLKALGHRYLRLQSKKLPVLNDLPIEVLDLKIDVAACSVTITWLAADPNIDAFNAETEEGDGPTTEERVAGESLTPPTIDTAVAFYASTGTGGEGVRLRVTAEGPERDDLNWFVRWREVGAASWVERKYSDADPDASVVLETDFVPGNVTVQVQVAYQTGGGSLSDWGPAVPMNVNTSTAGLAPGQPTGFGVTPGVGHAVASWTNPTSSNFVGARVWRGTTTLATATDVSGLRSAGLGVVDSFDNTGVAAGSWKFWVTAENASGVKTAVGPITVNVT